ncbi:B12-binding domain-containing radical SAM protein [candidate division WWE3 bacterium CG_4_9_14_0_2_um_filter_35_11]|uniref:B12-binding domain-containing radical SAM protein n=1 Tax=candidate division WWE3 bacterium CG_4_9_14_0_2_um_filter_35_11 TaxID=1975077 RepID=A0A2M8EMF8_UNCKA|nr:MAG: B12-binding domain-containing radical SAM protein [candidate division WWE3 bacterium CG10_big_fil_rev_8_21_14_0_10_35_32]PJC23910.1 MAG: B12-binding domain-containing radical SAM protein [candidate division WWE3 bacterium CG_4_9_14_0_2_um_filter_35_11]
MKKEKSDVTVVVGYPPIETEKGTPLLSQNRQFQYFNSPTYIYPMVPAYAASNLKDKGYRVYWMDGISEGKKYDQWIDELTATAPDFLLMETKSPVVKAHWKIIDDIKSKIPDLKIVIVGDHVTAFPEETLKNCSVDYIIKGGDYDFVIVNLLNHIYAGEDLEGGVYWRDGDKNIKAKPKQTIGKFHNSGPTALRHKLDDLPFVDRDLTKWELYAYENGNYKYTPATYMYSGRDCWWNRCTFCVWDHTINPIGSYRSFSPERLFAEVKHVVDNYGVREIFDDAGTLFIGPKLKKFCDLLIESGYNKKVVYGCNMRFNALTQEYYDLMAKAGFRFILYGMESGNQKTLDKLDKGTKEEDTINGSRMASKAGLEPHATIMLGYPWESYEDAKRTIEVAKYCFKKGYFNTMQATIVIPYPATPLWKECKEKGWLLTEDYDDYDMRGAVMKIPFSEEKLMALTQDLYSAFLSPQYMLRKVISIRNLDDIKFFYMAGKKLMGHLLDFDPSQTDVNFKSMKFWKNAGRKLLSQFSRSKTLVDAEKDLV